MTCIAYRDGIIAADTQESLDNGHKRECVKLYRVGDVIIGTAGNSYTGLMLVDWYCEGADRENLPTTPIMTMINEDIENFECIVVRGHDDIITVDKFFQPMELELEDGYTAIGCGACVALGAMYHGATATEAVEAAIKHDLYTGGSVTSMNI